jgi:hypothetical protein
VSAEIQRTAPPGSSARINWVHGFVRAAGTQTPNVDIVRSGQIAPIVTDLEFGGTNTIILAAGTYDFTIRVAGTQQGGLFTVSSVVIQAGKIYSIVLKGVEGQGGALAPGLEIIEEPEDPD